MGYKVQEIVQAVSKRTQSKAKDRLDLDLELSFAIDEFCADQHFWWRFKTATFPTIVGTRDYDLSTSVPDLQEIDTIIPITALIGTPNGYGELTPITSAAGIIAAQNDDTPGPPSAWFMTPGAPQSISLAAKADQVATLGVGYWAVPGAKLLTDAIPLVPPSLHWGLIYALERRVYEFLYGERDPRFVMANKRYDDFLNKAATYKQPATGLPQEMRFAGGAVRANTRASAFPR